LKLDKFQLNFLVDVSGSSRAFK